MTAAVLLGLLAGLLAGQTGDPLTGARALRAGRQALQEGRTREARTQLARAVEVGTPEQALESLDCLAGLEPQEQGWPRRMNELLTGAPPLFFPEGVRERTAGLWAHCTGPQAPGGFLYHRSFLSVATQDPRYGWRFDHLRAGYVWEEGRWRLRFRVCYPARLMSRGQRDYEPLAEQVTQALLQFYILSRDRFGLPPRYDREEGVVDVWLSEEGEPGAEQWHDNLYLYSIAVPRDGLEWLRELAHEWGHHTVPPLEVDAGRYEQWVSGDVGERLYLWHWLQEVHGAGVAAGWSEEAGREGYWAGYLEYVLRPGWEDLCSRGPAGLPLKEDGDRQAEALLALAFGCDLLWGERMAAASFRNLLRPAPADFRRALERSWEELLPDGIPLRPARPETLSEPEGPFRCTVGEPLPYWVLLTDVPFRFEVTLQEDQPGVALVLRSADRTLDLTPEGKNLWAVTVPAALRGWQRVRLESNLPVQVVSIHVRLVQEPEAGERP